MNTGQAIESVVRRAAGLQPNERIKISFEELRALKSMDKENMRLSDIFTSGFLSPGPIKIMGHELELDDPSQPCDSTGQPFAYDPEPLPLLNPEVTA